MHAKIKKTYNHKIKTRFFLQNGHRRWFKPYQKQKTESLFFCSNIKDLFKDKMSNFEYHELRIRSMLSKNQWEEYV